jgi:hypothetical protein
LRLEYHAVALSFAVTLILGKALHGVRRRSLRECSGFDLKNAGLENSFHETMALVLSHDEHEIRAITPGGGDALAFTCIHGTWISEGLERYMS